MRAVTVPHYVPQVGTRIGDRTVIGHLRGGEWKLTMRCVCGGTDTIAVSNAKISARCRRCRPRHAFIVKGPASS